MSSNKMREAPTGSGLVGAAIAAVTIAYRFRRNILRAMTLISICSTALNIVAEALPKKK